MNRRAVLLAVAVALVAVLTGSTLLPAVGSAFGFWGVASGGWRLWSLMGSGRFNQLSGAKDVYRCAGVHA